MNVITKSVQLADGRTITITGKSTMQRVVFLVVLPSAKVKQVTKKSSHRVLLTVLFVHCSHQIITVKYSCKSRFYLLMALTNQMH